MAKQLTRRPASGGDSPMAVPAGFPAYSSAAWRVIISSFILAAKFAIAAPMYRSNTFLGGVPVLLAPAGLATLRRITR